MTHTWRNKVDLPPILGPLKSINLAWGEEGEGGGEEEGSIFWPRVTSFETKSVTTLLEGEVINNLNIDLHNIQYKHNTQHTQH